MVGFVDFNTYISRPTLGWVSYWSDQVECPVFIYVVSIHMSNICMCAAVILHCGGQLAPAADGRSVLQCTVCSLVRPKSTEKHTKPKSKR